MAQEAIDIRQTQIAGADADGDRTPAVEPALARSFSSSRLNAGAPEFAPRAAPVEPSPPMIHVFHMPPPPPPPTLSPPFLAPVARQGPFEYYVGGTGVGFGEQEVAREPANPEPAPPAKDGLPKEVVQKITKQVEYYFSDANLATTEHLMRFISKDPEGFVPISVIASFKKIKALVHNNFLLAAALRTSSKLVVSDDGKKVRRQQPFTESDVEELQSRIVVAENLPEDHCYRNLMRIFSAVGNVRTIRTCYPQSPNDAVGPANRTWKIDVLFHNKLHAFVEYQSIEDAKKAVTELNEERNWRGGLRVRLLSRCMEQHGPDRGRKVGHEDWTGDEDDAATTNPPSEKQMEDSSQSSETLLEHVGEESFNKDGGVRHARGRGRGGRGRGRGQYHHNNNRNGAYAIGNPPSSHLTHTDHQQTAAKQPPGPRMPDGTRGFTIGRGKPLTPLNTD